MAMAMGLGFQSLLLLGTPHAVGTVFFFFSFFFFVLFLVIGLHSTQTFLKLTESILQLSF